VVDWIKSTPSEKLFLSVISLGEIRRGVQLLKAGKKREQLLIWLEEHLPKYFGANILPIDLAVAHRWGFLTAHAGRTLPAIDGLLAATALAHNLKMVTRNEKDFVVPGLEVLNPF
jgi:predicted nucleic acid-binding protein